MEETGHRSEDERRRHPLSYSVSASVRVTESCPTLQDPSPSHPTGHQALTASAPPPIPSSPPVAASPPKRPPAFRIGPLLSSKSSSSGLVHVPRSKPSASTDGTRAGTLDSSSGLDSLASLPSPPQHGSKVKSISSILSISPKKKARSIRSRKLSRLKNSTLPPSSSSSSSLATSRNSEILPSSPEILASFYLLLLRDDCQLALLLLSASSGTPDETCLVKSVASTFLINSDFTKLADSAFGMELDSIPKSQNTIPTTFLRGECNFTRLFAEYLCTDGQPYRRFLIRPLIDQLCLSSDLEIDPIQIIKRRPPSDQADFDFEPNAEEQQLLNQNLLHLRELAQSFFESIISSINRLPRILTDILALITKRVLVRFPKIPHTESFSFLGPIIFLRFICPAVAMPNHHGVTNIPLPPHVSRALILISKMLQNLSNGVEFGIKEKYMLGLNTFIVQNRFTLRSYFRHLAHISSSNANRNEEVQGDDTSPRFRSVSNSDISVEETDPSKPRSISSLATSDRSPRETTQDCSTSSTSCQSTSSPQLQNLIEHLSPVKTLFFEKYVSTIVAEDPLLRLLVSNWVGEYQSSRSHSDDSVSYTHLRAHET